MGLLDELAGSALKRVLGGADGQNAQLGNIIGELLGDARQGGLDGLVRKFGAAGLDDVIKSWISTGANKAITADQLSKVLDPATLSALAGKAGLKPTDLLGSLASELPKVIDALTPDGKLPEGNLLEQGLRLLRGLKG